MAAISEDRVEELPRVPARAGESLLKRRLVEHLEASKHFNETIRVTQVSAHHFRVNFLKSTNEASSIMSLYRITKSQFLFVEEKAGDLVIVDQTKR